MPESVPVRCPACRREHLYAAPSYPCECGAPVTPPLDRHAGPVAVTHRTWDEDWVTVRCGDCGRTHEWPHPELGCPCGTALRIPVTGARRPERTGPAADGGADHAGTEAGHGTNAAGTDAAGSDAAGSDATGTDATGTDTVGSDTARTDTGDSDTGGSEAAGSDTPGSDTARTDTARTDTGVSDSGEADATDTDATGADASEAEVTAADGAGADVTAQADGSPVSPGGSSASSARPRRGPLPRVSPRAGRAAFQPVTIRTARDAVTAAALYLRWLGYRDIRRADQRPPSGIGLAAKGVVAQVDPTVRPASLRDVECLWLTAMTESAECVYFSLAGYADDARSRADDLCVPLFVLDLTGTPQPANGSAERLVTARA